MYGRQAVHPGVEFQGHAPGVADPQHPAHEGARHPVHRQASGGKPICRLVQLRLVPQFEARHAHLGRAALAQDHRMVAAFLHRAQTDRARLFMADLQAQIIHMAPPRPGQIGYRRLDMGQADDVERRVKVQGGYGHAVLAPGAACILAHAVDQVQNTGRQCCGRPDRSRCHQPATGFQTGPLPPRHPARRSGSGCRRRGTGPGGQQIGAECLGRREQMRGDARLHRVGAAHPPGETPPSQPPHRARPGTAPREWRNSRSGHAAWRPMF